MSDTPRTEAVNQYLRTRRDYTKTDHEVWMNHGIQLERELNAANDRIKRLEDLGKELCECAGQLGWTSSDDSRWIERAEAAVKAWDRESKP